MAPNPSDPHFEEIIRRTVQLTLQELRSHPPITPAALTMAQAAKYLNISVSKISRLKSQRKIPFVAVDSCIRFLVTDLNEWLAKHRQEAKR